MTFADFVCVLGKAAFADEAGRVGSRRGVQRGEGTEYSVGSPG